MTLTLDTAGFTPQPLTKGSARTMAGMRAVLAPLTVHKTLIISFAIHGLAAVGLLYSHTNTLPTPEPVGAVDMVFEKSSGRTVHLQQSASHAPRQISTTRRSPPSRNASPPPAPARQVKQAFESVKRITPAVADIAPLPTGMQGIVQANRASPREVLAFGNTVSTPQALRPLSKVQTQPRSASIPPPRPPAPQAFQKASVATAPTPRIEPWATTQPTTTTSDVANRNQPTAPQPGARTSASGTTNGANTRAGATSSKPGFRIGSAVNPAPEYPRLARRRGQQGRVVLRVVIGQRGNVENIHVRTSSGFRLLDRAALRTVKSWTFTPARQYGKPVAGLRDVPVAFRLHD